MSIVRILQSVLLSALLSTTALAQVSGRPSAGSLPVDFPKDIPVYAGATFISFSSAAKGKGASFSTDDAAHTVADFYVAELKRQGWANIEKLTAGPVTSITATKEERALAVGLVKGTDGKTEIYVGETTDPPWNETLIERDCRAAEPFDVEPIASDGAVTKPPVLIAFEEMHLRNPSDVAITEDLAEETYMFGVRLICKSIAAPGVKYPIALRFLRAALKLNPSHVGARVWVDEIASIYETLGKPVPEE